MVLLLLAIPAQAAEVTDLPPALRLDGSVSYAGRFENGHLREGSEDFGIRHAQRHTLEYRVEFAPIEGLAVWLALEHTPSASLVFEDGWSMGYDPATDAATYAGGSPLGEDVEHRGSGLDGVWFGVAGAPFAERRVTRGPQATWRLDAAFRTPDPKHTFWTADGDRRGVAPGGLGLMARAAFAVDNDPADTYLRVEGVLETASKVDVVDEDGTTRITDAKVNPADRLDVRAGIELTAWAHEDDGSDFGFDLFADLGYVGTALVPSGVLLPDVLDRTAESTVTSAAYVHFDGGVGMVGHVMKWVALRAAFSAGWAPARRPEEPYPAVIAGDTVALGIEASVEGRWR